MAGMTADNCNKLKVIQNSLNGLLTGARKETPTKDLLDKVIQTGKPEYIANKLELVYGSELEEEKQVSRNG